MADIYKEVNQTNTADVDDVNISGPIIQHQPQKTGFSSLQDDCIENNDASLLNETNPFRNPWDTSGRTVTSMIETSDLADPEKEKEKEERRPQEEVHNTCLCLIFPGSEDCGCCYCCDCSGDTVDGGGAIDNQDGCCGGQDGCCGDQDGCCGDQDCECGDCDCAGDCGDCNCGDCICSDCTIL